jgi:beta-lactamase class A
VVPGAGDNRPVLAPPPPVVSAPAAREVSFGRIAGLLPAGSHRVAVSVGDRMLAVRHVRGRSFDFVVDLPRREVTVRVTALGDGRGPSSASVEHVLGLPRAARPHEARPRASTPLASRLRALAASFPATSAIYVADLVTGATAGLDPNLRFPAASTLKMAIAVETLRELPAKPAPGSPVERLLQAMLLVSDNDAANSLEVLLAGSTSAGGRRIDETLRALGLVDTRIYGGYARSLSGRSTVPIAGKYTTAQDLGRLLAYVHLAADGRGLLARRFRREFTPSDARYLLYLLAHVPDRGKLGRYLPQSARLLHKAGWVSQERHDAGLVYRPGGAFVVVVMTYSPYGAGEASDVLAGRIARTSLDLLARPRRRRASGP